MENHSLDVSPVVLVLTSQSIIPETASTPLYNIAGSVTSIAQKDSTVKFERVEHGPDEAESPRNHRLFYLVHPVDARYRTDLPAHYYITSAVPGMIGNIRFETSKTRLQKTEHKALLSPGRSARDQPLFDETAQQLLFTVKPNRKGYIWTDATGRQVASEGDQCKLAITVPLRKDMADALVALWVLRLWYDTAESSKAKRECKVSNA